MKLQSIWVLLICSVFIFLGSSLRAQFIYERPGMIDFIKNIPPDISEYTKQALCYKNARNIAAMTLGTGLLIYYDDRLLDVSNNIREQVGWSKQLDWYMEHIGDGYLQLYVSSSLIGYGFYKKDNRALQSASQIFESVFASGVLVQLFKHVTGRESPFVATTPTGRWRPFPNQVDYHNHVPSYDAFPSGHVSTITAMVVVLSENYPEHTFIKPLGCLAIALNGLGMMNTGVHWMSDYPLGIALGYGLAKIAVKRGRVSKKNNNIKNSFSMFPSINHRGNVGFSINYTL